MPSLCYIWARPALPLHTICGTRAGSRAFLYKTFGWQNCESISGVDGDGGDVDVGTGCPSAEHRWSHLTALELNAAETEETTVGTDRPHSNITLRRDRMRICLAESHYPTLRPAPAPPRHYYSGAREPGPGSPYTKPMDPTRHCHGTRSVGHVNRDRGPLYKTFRPDPALPLHTMCGARDLGPGSHFVQSKMQDPWGPTRHCHCTRCVGHVNWDRGY